MGTVSSFIESTRYDLADYQAGVTWDDKELFVYLNRMIKTLDSSLAAVNSDLVHATEEDIDCVANQKYVDLIDMANGHWDSIRSVWIGEDRKYKISMDLMQYKRKFRDGTAEPEYWTHDGRTIIWEVLCDSAHTDLIIHYNKKTRPLLESWNDTFTAATTDIVTLVSGDHTFVTGDGPFRLTNSGGALPGGLATGTDYYVVYLPNDVDGMKLATSKAAAINGSVVDITTTGTGTHTMTMSGDYMPYDGIFDEIFREMLVMHSHARKANEPINTDRIYTNTFRKRAMEEAIRRNFIPKYYSIDY